MKKIFTILGIAGVALMGAQNLIPNAGFETWTDGKPDAWFVTPAQIIQSTNPVHSGAFAIGLLAANSTSNIGAPDVAVEAGKTYVYSGWYLDNVSNGRFRYWGQWRTASSLLPETTLQNEDYSTDSPQWVRFYVEAVAPATATVARLSLRTYKDADGSSGGLVYFDDVVFGEKGTMAVTDVKTFDKQVKMNTNVSNELQVILPGKATVDIYSADGRLMSSNRVNSGDKINTSSLVKGIYIVTVDNGSAKVSRKVVKN